MQTKPDNELSDAEFMKQTANWMKETDDFQKGEYMDFKKEAAELVSKLKAFYYTGVISGAMESARIADGLGQECVAKAIKMRMQERIDTEA